MPGTTLWIDAVAIDQGNDAEKGEQVSHMAEIYSGAVETYIWLGESTGLDKALEMLNQDPVDWTDQSVLSHVRDLYSHAYWNRAWTTQEMLLSKDLTVLTSRARLSWHRFQFARDTRGVKMRPVDSWFSSTPEYFWTLWYEEQFAKNLSGEGRHSLWTLLDRAATSRCADVRDRVYSLLSLAMGGRAFQVSYSETPVELFWGSADHFVAWNQPDAVRNLREALGLSLLQLGESLQGQPSRRLYVPVRSKISHPSSFPFVRSTKCGYEDCRLSF
jgi:hypothetical protein